MIVGSGQAAVQRGQSLAIINPRNTRFIYKRKTIAEVKEEREAFRRAARQTSLFDKELAQIEPSPFQFRFHFEDDCGTHNYQCRDWETHAMYWNWRRKESEAVVLQRMEDVYNTEYPSKGMIFAIGNQAKRPHVWQLLGVIRLDPEAQRELF